MATHRAQNEYVEFDMLEVADRVLGITILRPTSGGTWYHCICPQCGEPKFFINVEKTGELSEHWGCKRSTCDFKGKYPVNLAARLWGTTPKEAYKELLRIMEGGRVPDIAYNPKKVVQLVHDEPLAPVEHRHKVYTALLKLLKIKPGHLEDLKKRGLPDVLIANNGYRSFPTDIKTRWAICERLAREYDLSGVPGFYINRAEKWDMTGYPEGFFVPVRDINRNIQGMQLRIHPYNPDVFDNKYLWFTSAGKNRGTRASQWIHYVGNFNVLKGARRKRLYGTEGPLKGDIANYYLDEPFLAVPGTTAVRDLANILRDLGVEEVVNAFDLDRLTNPDVKKDVDGFVQDLERSNVTVLPTSWDTEWYDKPRKDGSVIKMPVIKGIDDACLTHVEKFLEVSPEDFIVTTKRTVTYERVTVTEETTLKKERPQYIEVELDETKSAAIQSQPDSATGKPTDTKTETFYFGNEKYTTAKNEKPANTFLDKVINFFKRLFG